MRTSSLLATPWFGPLVIAVVAWIGIVATIDPAGSYPGWPEGPGLTTDEMFNVEQGVYLVEALRIYGWGMLDHESIRDVFGPNSSYLPDHPPLGRLWLGLHHHVMRALLPPSHPAAGSGGVTACARTGSATAFAATLLLIGWFTGSRAGPLAGGCSALFLTLMPRLWGHAHLASLETMTNLTCTAAVLAAARGWSKSAPPSVKSSLLAGLILGLAFLTKIQAVLLPIPLILWCLWRWRLQAMLPLAIWGLTAAVVFFVGWPWLWLDPVDHARDYFARTTARAVLSVWYFGTQYADKTVPWHYPWVLFFTTIPLATLLFGLWPLFTVSPRTESALEEQPAPTSSAAKQDASFDALLLMNVVFPLAVFSLPNVAVYDGERLFLTAFPCWAILAGRGAAGFCERFRHLQLGQLVLPVCLLAQAGQLVMIHPTYLSYYNFLTNGTRGAERLGLETTYWGDSVTRTLLEDIELWVPKGGTVHLAPVLHQFQVDGPRWRADLIQQSPILRRREIRLVPFTTEPEKMQYLLIYRRRADLPKELRSGPKGPKLLAEVRRGKTQLAALYQFPLPDEP